MESIINKGGKIAETDVLTLIELLMSQLLKLDGIMADGDVKLQRKMQVCSNFYLLHLFRFIIIGFLSFNSSLWTTWSRIDLS
jgi:hypothetical protein